MRVSCLFVSVAIMLAQQASAAPIVIMERDMLGSLLGSLPGMSQISSALPMGSISPVARTIESIPEAVGSAIPMNFTKRHGGIPVIDSIPLLGSMSGIREIPGISSVPGVGALPSFDSIVSELPLGSSLLDMDQVPGKLFKRKAEVSLPFTSMIPSMSALPAFPSMSSFPSIPMMGSNNPTTDRMSEPSSTDSFSTLSSISHVASSDAFPGLTSIPILASVPGISTLNSFL